MSCYRPGYDAPGYWRPPARESRDSIRDDLPRGSRRETYRDWDDRRSQAGVSNQQNPRFGQSSIDGSQDKFAKQRGPPCSPKYKTRRNPAQLRSSPSYDPSHVPSTRYENDSFPNDRRPRNLCKHFPNCKFGDRCHFFHPEEIENESPPKLSRSEADRRNDRQLQSATTGSYTSEVSIGPASLIAQSTKSDLLDESKDTARRAAMSEWPDARPWGAPNPSLVKPETAARAWGDRSPVPTSTYTGSNAWGDSTPVHAGTSEVVGAAAWGSPSPPPSTRARDNAVSNIPISIALKTASQKDAATAPIEPRFATPVSCSSEASSAGRKINSERLRMPLPSSVSGSISRGLPTAGDQSGAQAAAQERNHTSTERTKLESLSPQTVLNATFQTDSSLKRESPTRESESEEDEEVDELAEDDNQLGTAPATSVPQDVVSIIARVQSKPVRYLSTAELLVRFDREFPDWLPAQ